MKYDFVFHVGFPHPCSNEKVCLDAIDKFDINLCRIFNFNIPMIAITNFPFHFRDFAKQIKKQIENDVRVIPEETDTLLKPVLVSISGN